MMPYAGTLTQEQADWLIERAEALAPFQLTNPLAGERAEGSFGGRVPAADARRFLR